MIGLKLVAAVHWGPAWPLTAHSSESSLSTQEDTGMVAGLLLMQMEFFGTKTCKIQPVLKSYTSVLSQPLKDLTALAEVIHICHTYLPSGNR